MGKYLTYSLIIKAPLTQDHISSYCKLCKRTTWTHKHYCQDGKAFAAVTLPHNRPWATATFHPIFSFDILQRAFMAVAFWWTHKPDSSHSVPSCYAEPALLYKEFRKHFRSSRSSDIKEKINVFESIKKNSGRLRSFSQRAWLRIPLREFLFVGDWMLGTLDEAIRRVFPSKSSHIKQTQSFHCSVYGKLYQHHNSSFMNHTGISACCAACRDSQHTTFPAPCLVLHDCFTKQDQNFHRSSEKFCWKELYITF